MQYFGPLDKLPLNISLLGGYTNMNVDYDIEDGEVFAGSGQRAELELNSYTLQAIAHLTFQSFPYMEELVTRAEILV